MRAVATGLLILLLLAINTLLMIGPLLALALLKLIPARRWRALMSKGLTAIAQTWASLARLIFAGLTRTHWDIRGAAQLRRDASYLLICNHRSWVDIPALIETFSGRIPFFRFFIKRELIWVPLLGLAFWALDYPRMRRHSKEALARNPQLRQQDLDAARRACEKFRDHPVSVVNFLEGTRFTPAKHDAQQSPYRHLLKPKSGGVAYTLGVLGDQFDALLDVTLVYPDGVPGFWALLCDRVPRVIVDIRTRPLDPALWQGDYQQDTALRERLQEWVNALWAEKDARIEQLLDDA